MNPTTEEQLPPPPQPPQPHRSSTSCERHPDENFTGFCPSCLCERLAVLDNQSSASTSTGRKSASSALKSLFRPNNDSGPALRGRPSTSSFLPELRRTKSFSGGKNDGGLLGVSGAFEPQRKSCDVRGRSTLFALFNQDQVKRHHKDSSSADVINGSSSSKCGQGNSSVVIEFDSEGRDHVAEVSVVEEVSEEEEEEFHDSNDNGGEIQEDELHDQCNHHVTANNINNNNNINNVGKVKSEITEEEASLVEGEKSEKVVDLKTMKDYIDIDSHDKKAGGTKDLKELAGSFWSAASVFSKKFKAWTKKNHKLKKHNGCHTVQVSGKKGNAGRNCRDTQSEIADYGFGRRSCDTDPRFSLDAGRFSVDVVGPGRYSVDAGRMSFDDPRGSFDEPRASWDGYLIGRTAFPRMIPPMVSVVEDAPVVVSRHDMQIPVEEPRRSSVSIAGDDGGLPGGASQTKDYYSDSSSKRRKSLDRSSSIRKTAAAVVAEMDEMKNNGCNIKVAPPCVDYLNGGCNFKVVANDRDLNASSNSLRDNYSESFDMGLRDNASLSGNGDRKGSKKSRRWRTWNIWSLLYRRSSSGGKDEEDDRYSRANGVERSLSESWQDYRRDGYGDPRAGFGRNVLRSNSSVSWRNSYNVGGSFGSSIRQGSIEVNGHGKKKRDEFVLERNRSARYSPKHADNNGMLRFYLTPMRGSRKGSSGKPKPAYSHSFARNMLRMY
ncbi:hypothetical protein RND81_06G074200 [Saponaria officinalis]|uniref:Uncharacterized protein n=1 Tax=Saponaria officinalis TaxID=3572 RepID=A0AAW1K8E8_SAPOF